MPNGKQNFTHRHRSPRFVILVVVKLVTVVMMIIIMIVMMMMMIMRSGDNKDCRRADAAC